MTGRHPVAGGDDRNAAPAPADLHPARPPRGDPDPDPQQPTAAAVAVVLAAGGGQRYGAATKQLQDLDGRPLVAHVVQSAIEAGIRHVVVVVGHDGQRVAHAARRASGDGPDIRSGGVRPPPGTDLGAPSLWVVHNRDHAAGQSTSLVAGIRAVLDLPQAEIAVLLLADQPRVDARVIREVAATVAAGAVASRARYLDGPGHPVAFARSVWPRLLEVTGDRGARDLLRELPVVEVAVDRPIPRDVDTPADLDAVRAGEADTSRLDAAPAPADTDEQP